MEFLTTYGWAFIVIIVAISALSYLGVFNISNFVPNACSFPVQIACPVFAVEKDATRFAVNIQLENGMGDRVEIVQMGIKEADLEDYCLSNDLTNTGGTTLATVAERTLSNNQAKDFVFEFDDGVNGCSFIDSLVDTTRKVSYDVRLYYIPDGASQLVSTQGRIIAKYGTYTP